MRITESGLKRIIRKTINEMSDDGMGSYKSSNIGFYNKCLAILAEASNDPHFTQQCIEDHGDLGKELIVLLKQINRNIRY